MYRNKRITVCLPCRNESNHLKEVIAKVPKFVDEIIVISNKSTDNTMKIAKSLGVKAYEDNRVIGNIGYGFAHMTGIEKATGDLIVGEDGDGTYPIEELDKVIDHLLDNNLDFISCNRYPLQEGIKIPFKLRLGVWLLNTEIRVLYGKKINDILSGMWVFKKDIKEQLGLTMGDWNLSPQIKLNAVTNSNIAFAEYSIAQYQRMGESKQNYFQTGLSHALWIAKNRFVPAQVAVDSSQENTSDSN
jgi:glycosyltransferase involved in cell wall biosynthesis